MRVRHTVSAAALAVVISITAGYAGWLSFDHRSAAAPPRVDPGRGDTMIYLDAEARVRQATRADPAHPFAEGPTCHRAYAAAGTLICLRPADGVPDAYEAAIFDRNLVLRKRIDLWGTPSRARVSPSGHLIAWTVFHSGDSYLLAGQFSTIAGIYDLTTGEHHGSLEDFTARVDGVTVTSTHVNYWGITFAADDHTFYATMGIDGQTWLVRGDLRDRTLTALQGNVECPSLSPDGTRIAYKKKIGGHWRLHVLDLTTGRQTPLAEQRDVDDQAAWLDTQTVAYRQNGGVFAVPADGTGTARLLLPGASSPASLP
ncbi:hypothetical protein HDA40_006855 [Hamadaea flava]|uniref:WD40 repeat protein n=1 Tax=Hamadaea flava TaxID=1742688 RepID=A0ABV8LU32_9ACTN|nr:hypothetical protein [Hamadaea flava]MCP2328348.1 hypothetical protein [Hamadaea flava]